MHNRLTTFIYLLILSSLTEAHGGSTKYQNEKYEKYYNACSGQMQAEVTFCDASERSCSCSNSNSLATLAGCLYSVGQTSEKSWSPLSDYCSRYQITLDDDWFDTALENYKENAKSASEIENFNMSEPIDVPFILNSTNTKIYQESYGRFYDNLYNSIYYGAGYLGYWLLVLLLGAIFNWTKVLFPGLTKKMTNPVINFWRAN
ncbi:hypothetical protein CANMA_002059, partial [Candida margitis]|uniref:uncharacterized protein n=1 Tax=Candida margitis TaxID=1775924 RepID=UPI002225C6BD